MIADEIFRGRYRHSFTAPEAVKPGEVAEYKWSLHGVDHTFLRGTSRAGGGAIDVVSAV